MKDMGETSYILRVKIDRDRSRDLLALLQEPYIKKILERFNMPNCKPIDTPIAKGLLVLICVPRLHELDRMVLQCL